MAGVVMLVVTMLRLLITMDSNKNVTANFIVDPNAPSLNLTGGPLSFGQNEGGTKPITVSSNVNWTVSSSDGWINFSPNSGSNNGTVNVSVDGNNGSYRSGTITITGGGLSRVVGVSQQGNGGGEFEVVNQQSPLGTNFASIKPYSNEWVFQNLVKHGLKWVSLDEADYWNAQRSKFGKVPLQNVNDKGYPNPGQTGKMSVMWASKLDNAGTFICTFDGDADLEFFSDSGFSTPFQNVTRVNANRYEITLPNQNGGYFLNLKLTRNSNSDPLDNLKIYEQRFDGNLQTFYPEFLDNWKMFKNFRYMDWMETNHSKIVNWNEYPKDGHCVYTDHVPIEVLVELSNLVQVDAWFCAPHKATDNFVREMAKLIKGTIDPNLDVYVEYSNEVWNGGFSQTQYAENQGLAIGLDTDRYRAGRKYYAKRSAEIHNIFKQEFGSSQDKLINLVAWQAYTPDNGRAVAEYYNDYAGVNPDAVSCAPYFGVDLGRDRHINDVQFWNLDKLFKHLDPDQPNQLANGMEEGDLLESFRAMEAYKDIADDFGALLIAYEGGNHLLGVESNGGNQNLINLFTSANKDPRMKDIYRKYFNKWRDLDADVFAHFSSATDYNRYGSWGAKEFGWETRAQAPKYDALLTFIEQNPVTWNNGEIIWSTIGTSFKADTSAFIGPKRKCRSFPTVS